MIQITTLEWVSTQLDIFVAWSFSLCSNFLLTVVGFNLFHFP